jgi:hypothetical protein
MPVRRHIERGAVWMLAVMCSTVLATAAQASPTTYTSQAAFLGALSTASQTLTFDGVAAGTLIPTGGTEGGVSFTYSLGGLTLQVRDDFGTTSPLNYLGVDTVDGTFLNGESFTMVFASPVTALGLYVIGAPEANVAGDFLLSATGSGSVLSTTPDVLVSGGDAYFLGIIDLAGFSDAQLLGHTGACDPANDCQYVWNVDDIVTSSAGEPVPEPSTLLLLGSGLAGAVRFVRRRRNP